MKVLTPQGEKIDLLTVNIGPSHPATHGALRAFVALDGETIASAVSEIGYLHRGFEKMVEQGTWQQVLPYTDRLNYCSAILNNVGFCHTIERMFEIDVPDRTRELRVLLSELSRIIDHSVCVAAAASDLGALTNYFYLFNPREKVYAIWEKLSGARLTNTFTRIGGLYRDTYDGFESDVAAVLVDVETGLADAFRLLEHNRIFIERTRGCCPISPEDAIAWGWTGPCLRATGVERDLRKDEPYMGYETYDFQTVVGTTGDTFDRLMVRMYEIQESISICRQVLSRLRPGPINTTDPRLILPGHGKTYHDMEALINHFKVVFEGVRVPAGEFYGSIEAANGELGFFVVSDGSGKPWKIKVRPPCFTQFAAFANLVEGSMVADAIACLSSINIIAGELDR
ncbi:MAG TPA: NADH-quinone oxidoreductase subunit D [Fibrobacteria bacterium]|nr:NADH-quinone oxidoreductase subunit D [Fibrobacteria bacterium]